MCYCQRMHVLYFPPGDEVDVAPASCKEKPPPIVRPWEGWLAWHNCLDPALNMFPPSKLFQKVTGPTAVERSENLSIRVVVPFRSNSSKMPRRSISSWSANSHICIFACRLEAKNETKQCCSICFLHSHKIPFSDITF